MLSSIRNAAQSIGTQLSLRATGEQAGQVAHECPCEHGNAPGDSFTPANPRLEAPINLRGGGPEIPDIENPYAPISRPSEGGAPEIPDIENPFAPIRSPEDQAAYDAGRFLAGGPDVALLSNPFAA